MTVLHCIPSMEGGGAERQLTYLAAGLRRLGLDVHVAAGARGPNWERLLASGVTVHELQPRGTHDPRLFWRLVTVINSVRPDVVQVWLRQMDLLGGLAALAARRPFILTERSSKPAYPPGLKHAARIRMGRQAAAIIANSEGGDRYWQEHGAPHVPRYVIPNAVPLDEIERVEPQGDGAAAEACRPLVLFAGRLEPEKNIELLIEAVRLALGTEDFDFLCCGAGSLRESLMRRVTRHGLGSRARLAGYTPSLWSLMKRAALLVAPSVFEGNPNVVLEAMACRCPLVVSDISEHRAILDERSAVMIRTDSAETVARAIVNTLRDRAGARSRAEVAFDRVRSFAPDTIARRYLDVYRTILIGQAGEAQGTCAGS